MGGKKDGRGEGKEGEEGGVQREGSYSVKLPAVH